jgi:hypothetical protein
MGSRVIKNCIVFFAYKYIDKGLLITSRRKKQNRTNKKALNSHPMSSKRLLNVGKQTRTNTALNSHPIGWTHTQKAQKKFWTFRNKTSTNVTSDSHLIGPKRGENPIPLLPSGFTCIEKFHMYWKTLNTWIMPFTLKSWKTWSIEKKKSNLWCLK